MGTIDATDREALERCLVTARAEDGGRRQQIDSMLASEPWENVAIFACTCAQYRSLDLPPWQSPPFRCSQSLRDLSQPYGDASGRRECAELRKRLRDAGLSVFEPDPIAALARIEAEQVHAAR